MNTTYGKRTFRIKPILYGVGVALFVVLLFELNPIVASRYTSVDKVYFDDYYTTADTLAYLDSATPRDDIGEQIFLSGWAFASTTQPNDNRTIDLLFLSGNQCYRAKTSLTSRNDLADKYRDVYGIVDTQIGFVTEVSTINMKSGVYDVYAYVRENDDSQGIAFLHYQLTKTNAKVEAKRIYMD